MALIGKIRNNPLIILLFIGGGIALFILSEMTSGANGPIGPVERRMGQIGQREIDQAEFERTLGGAFSGGDAYQNRDALWQFYVDEGVVAEEAEAIGLVVPSEELRDLEFGPNPSPIVRRNLTDPNTGQLNRQLLTTLQGHIENGTLQDAIDNRELNPDIRDIWVYQRRNVITNRLQEKINALVTKGMYAPSWQAQAYADDQISNRRAAVTKIPFDQLNADVLDVSDSDIQAYLDENSSLFNNPEESRTLSYVAFAVEPSAGDVAELRADLADINTEWRRETSAESDSLFALANNGTYSGQLTPRSEFSETVAEQVFGPMSPGEVYGPYEEDGQLHLVKLIDRIMMADSASTRHILLSASTPAQFETADALADSLMNVLNRNRGKFEDLVTEYSEDNGSKDKGGVYENVVPGQFVPEYDDVLFRTGKVGPLYKVRTSYGVHIVEITERGPANTAYAKVAYISEPIVPSADTEDDQMQEAQDFLNGKKTLADLRDAGMTIQTTGPVSINTFDLPKLGSGQEVRDIMCWAFSANKGDLSSRVYRFTDSELFFDNNYVVLGLEDVIPAGPVPVDAIRETIEDQVRNRVAGMNVKGSLAGKTVALAAAEYNVAVDTVSVNLTLNSLPSIGNEPKVIAVAATANVGEPVTVVGNTGVFVVEALDNPNTGSSGSLPTARQQINSRVRNQVAPGILPALRVTTEVEDERMALECQ